LFQSSGIFVVANQHQSLAFYLVEQGYDVWMGNNRGVHGKHTHLTSEDEQYWDWSLDELGRYDFPALVRFVAQQTNQKIIYCGHSQGNAQAFVGLAINPDLAKDIEIFVAMAPAYYVNPFRHWSLKALQKFPTTLFNTLFGNKSFIPIMHTCQHYFHKRLFSSFSYTMFSYLFGWTSEKWNSGLKPAIFLTTPRPISTKLIQHWLKVSEIGKLFYYGSEKTGKPMCYELEKIRCPVAVFWGKVDSMVDGKKLINDLREKGVNVIFEHGVDGYEHMDLVWANDAVDMVFKPLVDVLEKVGG